MIWKVLAAGILIFSFSTEAFAETQRYTGSGLIERDELTMNMADGSTIFSARSQGVATISTEPPVLLGVKCMGLGLIRDEAVASSDVRCTFRATDDDAFDVYALTNADGGVISITGGSGRWAGVTGTGGFALQELTESGSRFTFELTMIAP